MELGQLAIDYSDGVIEAGADVNPQLLDYAKSKDLPILPFPGNEEYADAYTEFYNKIIGE
jgi:starch synthase